MLIPTEFYTKINLGREKHHEISKKPDLFNEMLFLFSVSLNEFIAIFLEIFQIYDFSISSIGDGCQKCRLDILCIDGFTAEFKIPCSTRILNE